MSIPSISCLTALENLKYSALFTYHGIEAISGTTEILQKYLMQSLAIYFQG